MLGNVHNHARYLQSDRGMFMTKLRVVAASVAAVAVLGGVSVAHAQQITVTPDQLKWSKSAASPSEVTVIYGNPRESGPFVVRARYEAGMKVMPHSHPIDIQVTVLSGTLLSAEGETFDESKLKEYPVGSFIVERANVPHYHLAKTAVMFQASGNGFNAFKYVDPAHDPRNK
jgi:quercetin dioxygenase-like cupin family protein